MPRRRIAIPKSNPNQKPADAVAGIVSRYAEIVHKIQEEKAKPKSEHEKE